MIVRPRTILITMATVLVASGAPNWARAEEAPSTLPGEASEAATSVPTAADAATIEYVGPDTYILLDKEGRPQPVLGMSYEEFVAAWKRMHQAEIPSGSARFAIEKLQANGTVQNDQVAMNVNVTVRVETADAIQIPLGLSDTIMVEEPRIEWQSGAARHEGSEKSFVTYDDKAGGYVAWIASGAKQVYISLQLLRPLVHEGNETRVLLNFPRAAVSRLALDVPERIAVATASEGVVKIIPKHAVGSSRIEVVGPRGDFRLSWSKGEDDRPELGSVVSATGAIGITIDGHSVRSNAALTVRSFGGGFNKLRVRLPPGAQLIDESGRHAADKAAPYRVVVESNNAGISPDGSLATIEFIEKQTGPVEISLSTEQPLGLTGEESSVQLAGFEVVGAVRQFGDVAVVVADDWQFRWENGPYVRQVERSDLDESLRSIQPAVAFQYDRQPWSLRAEIAPRPMIVQVIPELMLRIGVNEAELRARLKYQVPGARAFEFRVRLNGWELTPDLIESNGLVDRDRAIVSHDGELLLPLSQASPRRVEIEFKLRRALSTNARLVDLPLPSPSADMLSPGQISVIADPAIELLPDMSSSRGLVPVPVGNEQLGASEDENGNHYLYRTFGADAKFVARRELRPREISTNLRSQLSLNWQYAHFSQDCGYDVRYQPVTELSFELPPGWKFIEDRVQLISENETDEPILMAVAAEPDPHDNPTQIWRAPLARPRLGRFQVRAEFEFDSAAVPNDVDSNLFNLPLPAEVRVAAHQVEVLPAADMAISIDPGAETSWRMGPSANALGAITLSGVGANDILPLLVNPKPAFRAPSTRVERMWLQMWQSGSVIQDRAAIRFRTADTKAIVELPPSSTAADVEVLLDGHLAETSVEQEGRLVVSISGVPHGADGQPVSHTLELRYRRPAPAGLITRLAMTPPQLIGSAGLCDVLWHVVLPGDRQIVRAPGALSAIDSPQWSEVLFGREEAKSQLELEQWIGAASQPGPTPAQNSYIYSALTPVSIELVSVPRWLIVLMASGGVLVLAGAWLYLPAKRRRWIAVAIAIVIFGMAFTFPPQAVLVGRSAILGLVLVAVSVWLHRRSGRGVMPAVPPPTAGSTNLRVLSSLRSDSYYTPIESPSAPPLASHSAGETPPTPVAVSEVDR